MRQRGTATLHYDWNETLPSVAVVEAIATAEDRDPAEIGRAPGSTLYGSIDPDALDRLVRSAKGISVSLVAFGYRIQIEGNDLRVEGCEG